MLIGPNDFCLDICYHKHPEEIIINHERDLLSVFRILRASLTRTMLNVVLPPSKRLIIDKSNLNAKRNSHRHEDIKVLVEFKGKPQECETLHHFECPCFFGLRFQAYRERYYKIIDEWQRKDIEVASREEFHDRKV